MATPATDRRVYFLGNPEKPDAGTVLVELCRFFAKRCEVVGSSVGLEGRVAIDAKADRIVVIGGDGTLIGVARSLGPDQIPLIGVNVGKLGFLAEFSIDELKAEFDRAICDDTIVSPRAILQATIDHGGQGQGAQLAINDCVIQAGPPYRVIRLGISINGHHLTEVDGDGLIVCTPTGSTAHNLSAGGPIMQAGVDAIVLTPLCAHSLTHRPLVIEREALIDIHALDVNEGTTVIIDGQVPCPLRSGDQITLQRYGTDLQLVHNPLYAKWHNLVTKLHWGRPPLCG